MKKLMILSLAFLGVLHAQTGNHIHHLFGLKESTIGLFTLDALDQKTGNSVEIETFTLNINLGGNYAFRTVDNSVYYVDNASQLTVGLINNYLLPELFTTSYQGSFGFTTFQSGLTDICVNPAIDSLLYAFDINVGTLTKFGLNGSSAFAFTQGLTGIVDTSSISMAYYDGKIYLSGTNSLNNTVVYTIDEQSMQLVDSQTVGFEFLYLVADENLGLFGLGLDNNVYSLQKLDVNSNVFQVVGGLPSCTTCATETFLYDRNAMVIDSANQQLVLSRTEIIGGGNIAFYLSTYDLQTASPVYEIQTPERYSNLIFQTPEPDLVYPGDTDHDKDVDMQDLLAIGLFYNDLVTERIEISTDWVGQAAVSVGAALGSGVDKKHADCNGDGQVNAIDYNAIALNYSYTHYSDKSTNANCDFPMYVVFPNLVKADEPTAIQIGLDLSSLPSQNVYGVTFTIEYDSSFVVQGSMNTQGGNTWFGTEDANYIQRNQNDHPQGKMDVGVVGIDKLNRTGGGILIDGIWTMEDVVIPIAQGYREMPFKISNVYIIDYDENVIDACGVDTIIRVYDKNVGVVELPQEELEIYPNPTKASFVSLSHVDDIQYVEMYDMQGRKVQKWFDGFDQLYIGEFNKGIYILKAYTADKIFLNKLVYNKE